MNWKFWVKPIVAEKEYQRAISVAEKIKDLVA